jgi:hypothetical protein
MKKLILGIATLGLAAVVGCGSDTTTTNNGFPQPAGTVAVNFSVNDSQNKLYAAGDLQWKGAFKLADPATRIITADGSWGGPYPVLFDDGPWTAGGHEPDGAVAGDGIWGVTVFVAPPATGTDKYGYGLQDATSCSASSLAASTCAANGWSWLGSNGEFAVAAGATAAINATGRSFSKFGTTDLQLKATKSALDSFCSLATSTACTTDATCNDASLSCSNSKCVLKTVQKCTGGVACPAGTGAAAQVCKTPDTTKVQVKSSAFTWNEVKLTDDGSGNFIFTLSALAGTGKTLPHTGLLNTGDKPEFLFVFNGNEYRDFSATGGPASAVGITAATKASSASTYTTQTINTLANGNTSITSP